MKEYNEPDGYVHETVLIFEDPDLKEEEYSVMRNKLSTYTGNHGEVIEIKILKNEEWQGAIIHVVIICFKSLLKLLCDQNNTNYDKFIESHKIKFEKYYFT